MNLPRLVSFFKESRQVYQAIRLVRNAPKRQRVILLVGHEMKMSGASLLLIHVARNLADRGYMPILLINAGATMSLEAKRMLPQCTALLQLSSGSFACRAFLKRLVAMGVTKCLANTVVTGLYAKGLHNAGFEATWLIHEMKGSCQILQAEKISRDICLYGKNLVFPNNAVRDNFLSFVNNRKVCCNVSTIPQGIYKDLPTKPHIDAKPSHTVRRHLGLPEPSIILLGSGAVNFGKGIDLLVSTLMVLRQQETPFSPPFHVVWLGSVDDNDPFTVWLKLEIANAQLGDRWHWAGYISDDKQYNDYLYAADVFVLPSREDANPSVALEAAAVGLPIAAFSGSGGGAELAEKQHGMVAAAGNIADYANLVQSLSSQRAHLHERLNTCATQVVRDYDFSKYVDKLLTLMR